MRESRITRRDASRLIAFGGFGPVWLGGRALSPDRTAATPRQRRRKGLSEVSNAFGPSTNFPALPLRWFVETSSRRWG